MSHTWALIPVKSPEHSKTRLASVLQPHECANLSRAMFMDVLAAMATAAHIDRIAVLTNDDEIAGIAEKLGHLVLADECEGKCSGHLNVSSADGQYRAR